MAVECAIGLLGRLGDVRAEAQRVRNLARGFADRAIIVQDQQVEKVRSLQL
jgi:electron transfer flavoprotein alpha/beta subunit